MYMSISSALLLGQVLFYLFSFHNFLLIRIINNMKHMIISCKHTKSKNVMIKIQILNDIIYMQNEL